MPTRIALGPSVPSSNRPSAPTVTAAVYGSDPPHPGSPGPGGPAAGPVPGVNVAEHQPAQGGIYVQGLAGARGDPGQAVVGAEGGQAVADAEDPDQVVDGHYRGIHGDLRADRPVGA